MNGSILITGANGGLGSAFISKLMYSPHAHSCYGIYAVRNVSTAHELSKVLSSAPTSHSHELLSIDLSSLDSVRAAATLLNRRVSSGEIPPIRALILNAAVQHVEGKVVTVDGWESHFAVNYLANFLFVLMILESMDREQGRIVMVSTAMHDSFHWMNSRTFPKGGKEMFKDTDTVADGGEDGATDGEKHIEGMRRYSVSKCLLVMFMCV
jgi:NAD(P)-dependent dehydrogenase (short-subunit alcohol dehydrogenase family)